MEEKSLEKYTSEIKLYWQSSENYLKRATFTFNVGLLTSGGIYALIIKSPEILILNDLIILLLKLSLIVIGISLVVFAYDIVKLFGLSQGIVFFEHKCQNGFWLDKDKTQEDFLSALKEERAVIVTNFQARAITYLISTGIWFAGLAIAGLAILISLFN